MPPGRDGWNQRPRDAANITRWIGRQTERALNWQIVNLKVDISDRHDAPVLDLSGTQALNFSKQDREKLKLFVEASRG